MTVLKSGQLHAVAEEIPGGSVGRGEPVLVPSPVVVGIQASQHLPVICEINPTTPGTARGLPQRRRRR